VISKIEIILSFEGFDPNFQCVSKFLCTKSALFVVFRLPFHSFATLTIELHNCRLPNPIFQYVSKCFCAHLCPELILTFNIYSLLTAGQIHSFAKTFKLAPDNW